MSTSKYYSSSPIYTRGGIAERRAIPYAIVLFLSSNFFIFFFYFPSFSFKFMYASIVSRLYFCSRRGIYQPMKIFMFSICPVMTCEIYHNNKKKKLSPPLCFPLAGVSRRNQGVRSPAYPFSQGLKIDHFISSVLMLFRMIKNN